MGKHRTNGPDRFDPNAAVRTEVPPQFRKDTKGIITVPAQIVLMGNDGYTNQLASLGEASPTMSAGTFVRSGLTEQQEQLSVIYRECSIAKRIIDMPSEDMTRAWYTLSSAQVDETDLNNLKALEARHIIKQELTNSIRWARLYGGSIAIMIIEGEEERMDRPLNLNAVRPGAFKGVLVADLTQGVTPSMELEEDLDDPDYGLPEFYEVNMEMGEMRSAKIHHSRVLRFTGRELPHTETIRNSYWGASELEHPMDEIRRYLSTCENIAQLMFQANLITLKIANFGSDLAYGTDRLKEKVERTVQQENRMRTSYGVQILGAEDSMENHSYSFSGVADVKESFMIDVAGAAEIPATKLFGRSPQGMNATGEEDLRNYYDMIAQQQERLLRPALEKLLPVMAMSCWEFVPDDLKINFNPVMTKSPEETARISKDNADEIIALLNSEIITREEARAELARRGKILGNWGNIM